VDELQGRRFLDFVHPDDLQATLDIIARLEAQQPILNFTNRYRAGDGSYRFVEWRSYPVGRLIFAAARDVTERIQGEEALRQSEKRFDLTLQSTQAGTWEWNVQTGETIINERWADMLGYTLAELAPVTIQTWNDLVHPEDLQTANRLLEKHLSGESAYYECEVRMKHKAGHWVWIWTRGMVMEWAADHKPLRMFGTHTDITARKAAERHAFELALEKERVHLLNQFIQKASHEFRTPLSIINSNAFLMTYSDEPGKLQARVKVINEQVLRMTRLVETLLLMSKLESDTAIELAPVDMVGLIEGVCQRMISQYGYTPLLRYDIPPNLPSLMETRISPGALHKSWTTPTATRRPAGRSP
jgi:PAS domain S-box-containing protein